MSSRLFRAIVGIGIATGAACAAAACSGSSTTETHTELAADGALTPDPWSDSSVEPLPETPDAHADAGRDATAHDAKVDAADAASLDAPHDAILDAFCDATWPTTKGGGGPTCGDTSGCTKPAPVCYPLLAPGVCASDRTGAAAYCVASAWECSTGSVPGSECKCFGPLEAGAHCP